MYIYTHFTYKTINGINNGNVIIVLGIVFVSLLQDID